MTTLAIDLLRISRKAKGYDTATDHFLSTCKELEIRTVDQFDPLIAQAYVENAWSQKQGRPSKGSKLKPAPEAVKQCVYNFRRALTLGLVFADFKTVYALREAMKATVTPVHAQGPEPRPALKGVVLRQPHTLTGALWHDSPALAEELPEDLQAEYEAAIREIFERYLAFAPATLRAAEEQAA
jgi:hypothetical protein